MDKYNKEIKLEGVNMVSWKVDDKYTELLQNPPLYLMLACVNMAVTFFILEYLGIFNMYINLIISIIVLLSLILIPWGYAYYLVEIKK